MPNFDLSKWQQDYEDAPAEKDDKGGKTEVPDGKYQVRIARVELTASRKGDPMLDWELDILGPKCAGRKLWRKNFLASADNIKWLKQDLATCGVRLKNINDLNDQDILSQLIATTLEVTKKTKGEYSNVYLDKQIKINAPVASMPRRGQAPVPTSYSDSDIPF